VLLLVAELIELFGAAMDGAIKWFFRGMYSQMIEEVVPFPKELATEAVVTGKDTRSVASQRIRKFDFAKALYVGNMYLILKDGEIDGISVHGHNLSFFRHAESQPDALFDVDSRNLQRMMLLLRWHVQLWHLKIPSLLPKRFWNIPFTMVCASRDTLRLLFTSQTTLIAEG
jgi:hypothetical protein